jgi:thiol-disulfide isomerase/thioredoxin
MSAEAAVSALISKVGLVDNSGAPRSLDGKSTLLFYFSAHWCPPCKGFTPQLAKFYASHADTKAFEIVFVSSDNDETEFKKYFAEMPWASVTWGAMRSLKSCLGHLLLFPFPSPLSPSFLRPPPQSKRTAQSQASPLSSPLTSPPCASSRAVRAHSSSGLCFLVFAFPHVDLIDCCW